MSSDMHEKLYKAFHSDINNLIFDEVDELKDKLSGLRPYSDDEKDGLTSYDDSFLVKFTYETNAIEGSTLSLNDTELVLEGEFVPSDDKRLSEIFAARGCADGCAYIEKALSEGRELSEDLIKDVHERTALDCQPRTRGTYRVSPVYIRGSMTVPVDALKIRDLMQTLLYMYESSEAHPIAKAAAFHAMFENIHPFRDGNGRTGRLILNFMLEQQGYPPIAVKHDAKTNYKQALEQWQVYGNPQPFVDIVKDCITLEAQERIQIIEKTRETVKALATERDGCLETLKNRKLQSEKLCDVMQDNVEQKLLDKSKNIDL